MADFAKVVARAAALRAQAKACAAEADELLDSLGDLEIRQYPAGRYILKIEDNHRFDAATAKKNLTPEQYASILKPTPNAALAKALLEEDYALAQKSFGVKRTIVEVDDEED